VSDRLNIPLFAEAGDRGDHTIGSFVMAEASEQIFYYDRDRNRHGPFSEADFIRLIGDGTVAADSMIWHAGLPDWRAAGQVDKFASLFAGHVPPPPPRFSSPSVAATPPAGAMIVSLPVWGLFGRCLLVVIGSLFIIPAPWTSTMFYRYVSTHIALPDGRRVTFAGEPGDIWVVFIGLALLGFGGLLISGGNLFAAPLSWALSVLVFRWVCAKLGSEDGSVKLTFEGKVWGFIGWNVLLYLSFITIIGWAWVFKAIMRWICQNVHGTVRFEFRGTGLSILWRTLVLGFVSILIIPIPWLMRWYTAWLISQVHTVNPSA
jgi:hypothetical protein